MQEKKGNFWIWGLHSVFKAAEKCPEVLSEIHYVDSEISDATRRRLDHLRSQKSLEIKAVDRLSRSAEEQRHQGIAAHVKYFPTLGERDLQLAIESGQHSRQWMLLDGIEDPRNYGAILRSAAAFGVAGIIVGEKFQAPVNGVVAQASAGTCFLTPIYEISTTLKISELLIGQPRALLVGLDGSGTDISLLMPEICALGGNTDVIWIVGAEGKGIHSRLKQKIQKFVSIPMQSEVESLNASVAAGIVLFEGRKGLGTPSALNS